MQFSVSIKKAKKKKGKINKINSITVSSVFSMLTCGKNVWKAKLEEAGIVALPGQSHGVRGCRMQWGSAHPPHNTALILS